MRRIANVICAVIIVIAISIGWSELYSRNETFRKGYVGYSNTVAERIYDTMQAVGIKVPKVIVVE